MENEINFKDCVIGEIYYSDAAYLMRHDPGCANNVYIHGRQYHHGTGSFGGSAHKLRLATQEERDWFIACEKARSFIPKDEVVPKKEIINNYQLY